MAFARIYGGAGSKGEPDLISLIIICTVSVSRSGKKDRMGLTTSC